MERYKRIEGKLVWFGKVCCSRLVDSGVQTKVTARPGEPVAAVQRNKAVRKE
jgi:hypothetical protein